MKWMFWKRKKSHRQEFIETMERCKEQIRRYINEGDLRHALYRCEDMELFITSYELRLVLDRKVKES